MNNIYKIKNISKKLYISFDGTSLKYIKLFIKFDQFFYHI